LEDFFHDVFNCNTVENSFYGVKRATPLHAPLVFRCSDNDTVWIDLSRRKGNQRRRNVVEAMKWSKSATAIRMLERQL
jgi:hypothetical protein